MGIFRAFIGSTKNKYFLFIFTVTIFCTGLQLISLAYAEEDMATTRAKAGFKELAPDSVTSVPVVCRNTGATVLGNLSCLGDSKNPGMIAQIKSITETQLMNEIMNTYAGQNTDFVGADSSLTAIPVCNLTQGEINQNWMKAMNNCGRFCDIKIKTKAFGLAGGGVYVNDKEGSCEKEYGWIRGAYVQMLHYFKEKKFEQLDTKSISLVEVSAAKRPCAAVAADLIQAQQAEEKTRTDLIASLPEARKNSIECKQVSEKMYEQDPTVIAACSLTMANKKLISLWSQFLGCEIRWAAFAEYKKTFGDVSKWVADAQAVVGGKCEPAAKCYGKKFCSDSKRTDLFNECYQREVQNFIKSKMNSYDTPSKIKLPYSATTSKLDFKFFTVMGSLILRNNKKRSKKSLIINLAITILLVLSATLMGCSSGGVDDLKCAPCSGASTGLNECFYSTCMDSFYICPAGGVCFRPKDLSSSTAWNEFMMKKAELSNTINTKYQAYTDKMATSSPIRPTPGSKEGCVSEKDLNPDFVKFVHEVESLGLVVEMVENAQNNCRTISKMPTLDTGSAAKSCEVAATFAPAAEVVNSAIARTFGADKTCPANPPVNGPGAIASNTANSLATDLANTRDFAGTTSVEAKKELAAKPKTGGGAATGAIRNPELKNSKTGGDKKAGAGENLANQGGPSLNSNSGSGSGANDNGVANFTAPVNSEDSKNSAELMADTQALKGVDGFESARSNGGSAKRSPASSDFSSLFGGAQGSLGADGGVTAYRFGNGASMSDADLESYLTKMGNLSLFEVVNKRMNRWENEPQK